MHIGVCEYCGKNPGNKKHFKRQRPGTNRTDRIKRYKDQ